MVKRGMGVKKPEQATVTIKIPPAQIIEALKAHFNLPEDAFVWFDVQEQLTGYGMNEKTSASFKGADVTFKKNIKDIL